MNKNLRYLTTTLAATSFLACSPSYGLGIGGMKLQSSLNQNLKAEIALILSEGENAADLKVDLASHARFDEAGIPWTLFLSKIKFQTVDLKNGKAVVKLSSKEVLKEPFLDFLVEVRSAKSTAYREFTVLVDPPEVYEATQAPAILKENTPNSPQRFVSTPTPVLTTDSSSYGPVHENESLWSIARKFNRQNSVSVNQMVAAIYAANSEAFNGSTEAMITGAMLKIPGGRTVVKTKPNVVVKERTKAVPKEKTVIATAQSANTNVKSAPPKVESSTTEQKILELEKEFSEMKKMIAEQNAQIAALKVPELLKSPEVVTIVPKSGVIAPTTPVPTPVPVVVQPEKTPELPALPTIGIPPVPTLGVVPEVSPPSPIIAPVASIPQPAVIPTPSTTPNISTEKLDSLPSSSLPAGSYYYVAAAAGLLMLSLLGWLRLRNQQKVEVENSPIEPETIIDDETKRGIENELNQLDDSVFNIFDNETASDVEHESERKTDYEKLDDNVVAGSDFEEQSLSEFNQFMNDGSDKYNSGDLLYNVDVYCAYGDYDKAILLLRNEFTKYPEADSYALRLLKIYVLQNNKAEFVAFMSELTRLGKKEIPEFWMQVSDIANDFYPDVLSFKDSQEAPDLFANIATDDMFAKVDSNEMITPDVMSFDDDAISSGIDVELNVEELLNKATADFFKTPVKFDDENDDVEPIKSQEKFLFDEFKLESSPFDLDFTAFEIEEPVIKKAKIESEFDLDFTTFEVDEPVIKKAKIESEFDLDFTTFEVEEPAIKQPKIESAFDLDFSMFEVEEPKIKEPKIESEFDLDFTTFEVEEPKIRESKIESEFDLDFTTFEVEEPKIKEPKIESEFDLDFTTFEVEEPKIKEPKIESEFDLDFTTFEVEEPKIKEPKIESEFDLDFTIEKAHLDLSKPY